jgi:hypothetical protein
MTLQNFLLALLVFPAVTLWVKSAIISFKGDVPKGINAFSVMIRFVDFGRWSLSTYNTFFNQLLDNDLSA